MRSLNLLTFHRAALSACGGAALAATLLLASSARAKPIAPRLFCAAYPDVVACAGIAAPDCSMCHESTDPGAVMFNIYGAGIFAALGQNEWTIEDDLAAALADVEDFDSDGDGLTNIDELELGTRPGDELSDWTPILPPIGLHNPQFDVGNYDYAFALRRAGIIFCGESPDYAQMQAIREAPDEDAKYTLLHAKLDECLGSQYWIMTSLFELADKRIRPIGSVGYSPGQAGIGDFMYDYQLFAYALSGDHDVRDLLLAQYHVKVQDDQLVVADDLDLLGDIPAGIGPQPLEEEYRAGMATTQWFLVLNTMFAGLPRTTAAMIYRSYLGMDIAKQQGILPIPDEPQDLDNMGVYEEDCAPCHAALDALAYPFSYYNGVQGGIGTYDPNRPENMIAGWDPDNPPQGFILDQPVDSVTQWVDVAANSDEFMRNTADMLFGHMLGRAPLPDEITEFEEAWRALPDDGYSANALLHRLIDSTAFGVP